MLTGNDIERLNASKVGEIVELEDGRKIKLRVLPRASACNECDFRDEQDCTKINCANMSSIVYRNEKGI